MKELVALILFGLFVGVTIYLTIRKKITTSVTIVFLSFSLIAGVAISNYDIIKTISWQGVQLETFEQDVKQVKDAAINEIRKEIDEQKQSIKLLIADANDTRDKIELQKKTVELLNDTINHTLNTVEVP